jgi:hypothetical protein
MATRIESRATLNFLSAYYLGEKTTSRISLILKIERFYGSLSTTNMLHYHIARDSYLTGVTGQSTSVKPISSGTLFSHLDALSGFRILLTSKCVSEPWLVISDVDSHSMTVDLLLRISALPAMCGCFANDDGIGDIHPELATCAYIIGCV